MKKWIKHEIENNPEMRYWVDITIYVCQFIDSSCETRFSDGKGNWQRLIKGPSIVEETDVPQWVFQFMEECSTPDITSLCSFADENNKTLEKWGMTIRKHDSFCREKFIHRALNEKIHSI